MSHSIAFFLSLSHSAHIHIFLSRSLSPSLSHSHTVRFCALAVSSLPLDRTLYSGASRSGHFHALVISCVTDYSPPPSSSEVVATAGRHFSIALAIYRRSRGNTPVRESESPRAGYRSLRHRTASQNCLFARSLTRSFAHLHIVSALTRNARPTRARRCAADRSLAVSCKGGSSISTRSSSR